MNVSKTILCGTALSAIVLALPAQAQVTIGGDPIEVTAGATTDTENNGGALDLNGADITDSSGGPVIIDDSLAVTGVTTVNTLVNTGGTDLLGPVSNSGGTLQLVDDVSVSGTLTVDRAIFAEGGVATLGANLNTGGGTLNLVGGDIINGGDISSATLAVSGNSTLGGTLTVDRAIFAEGGVATLGANLNTGGGTLNLVGGDIINGDSISTATLAVSGNQTVGGTLTVDRAIFADGGLATRGANINTGGGTINLAGGNIIGVGTLTVTSNATIGQDLAVGRNLTVAGNITTTTGDIVTVSGDVVAGGIRLDSSTGRVTGVAAGVANTDAVNVGQLNAAVTGSLAAVNARIDTLSGRVSILEDDARKAFQGVAMGFAMNAAPLNLANGEGGISAGAGIFEGEYAGAIRAQFVTETGFGVGANVGFSEDSVGGGVGASIKF